MIKKLTITLLCISSLLFAQPSREDNNSVVLKKLKSTNKNSVSYSDEPIHFTSNKDSDRVTIVKNYSQPKEMFRTTWVASVENLNFPKVGKDGEIRNSQEQLKADWIEILNTHKKLNFNAVIFQVSPTLDALYSSSNRPWSHVLTGKQGVAPTWANSFDLIEWMIDETHARGMEFHAWFNPYRVTHKGPSGETTLNRELSKLSDKNFAKKNPNLAYIFDNKLYLNPGEPKVTKHIVDTIEEFLSKYDVDAIHFDDYFYPYNSTKNGKKISFGDSYEDRGTFSKNPRGIKYIEKLKTPEDRENYDKNVKEWRRKNTTEMVVAVKNAIDRFNKKNNRSVQWGISPFGIWEHKANNLAGSNTPSSSGASARDIYADTKTWVDKEYIDYIIPQVYWEFDSVAAPYGEITRWWTDLVKGKKTQLYIGHASYKHMMNGKNWKNFEEIPNQLRFNQKYKEINGSVLFGYNDVAFDSEKKDSNTLVKNNHIELLKNDYFYTKALTPPKPWLDRVKTKDIQELKVTKSNGYYTLNFKDSENDSRFYVVYIFNNKHLDSSNPKNISTVVGRVYSTPNQKIDIDSSLIKKDYYVGISIKDRAGVETPLKIVQIKQ